MRTARIAEKKLKQEEGTQVANHKCQSSSSQEEYTIAIEVAMVAFS